uniref:LOW QUALITY PROTEIN: ESF1 homolog n=1 Tax=Saccoglossus kowalevskii TaxID=10224 RepID=A0ABM0MXW7_SACKO|nr:PREDICTED: LOW QUALITY PROTEIN: ESF1 homolog [Saccoglossus kowalevskii]
MTKENDSDIFQDERFAHIKQDPRFQKMPRLERKVKIDKRFQGMFRDQRFKEKYTVDKRGRPVNLSTNEDLRKYYELSDSSSSDEEEEGEEEERKKKITKSKKKKLVKDTAAAVKDQKTSKNSLKVGKKKVPKQRLQIHSKVNQNDTLSVRAKTKLGKKQSSEDDDSIDLARGKGNIETSSEDDDDSIDLARGKGNIETSSEDDDSIDLDRGKGNIETSSEDDDDSIDLARGKGNIETSSEEEEDDESSSDEEGGTDEIEIEHKWGELDADAGSTTEATCRLAVCNMDWDRIKANDLLIMFNSFKPTGGIIKSVKIYPSEFGKERMKEEDLKGPKELVENAKKYFDDEDDEKYQTERLRHYQMQRLKYYYAVVECDSPTTANTIYEQCDRMEYESSATQLDLRFIPEDMEFEDVPTSVSSENVDIATFKPTSFISSALQQTQVHLTWDETNRDRLALTTKKFDKDEVMKLDVQDYLASSSDEEGNQGLKETTEELFKKKDQNEEMTAWQQYQKNKKEKKKEKKKEEEVKKKQIKQQQTGYLVMMSCRLMLTSMMNISKKPSMRDEKTVSKDARKKRKKKRKEEELTAEELEEKKQKEAELELLLMDEDDDKQHFSLKAIIDSEKQKKKRRKKKKVEDEKLKFQDNFEVDAHDPRFSAIYESHHYQIDPSDPHFKKTKAMDVIIQEKQRRREKEDKSTKVRLQEKAKEGNVKSGGQDKRVLSMLVKSVKNKTDEFNARKSKKLKLK